MNKNEGVSFNEILLLSSRSVILILKTSCSSSFSSVYFFAYLLTLMFLIAAPNTKDNVHLDVLSKLSVLMMDEVFADALRNAKSADEFLDIIDKADAEQGDIDERLADMNEASANGFKILAVTSCPTGIAHTYMAAEGIEKAAKEKDCFVKIESRGSGGAKNVLTEKEIKEADCIIVAADAQVPMDRFDGKKVII